MTEGKVYKRGKRWWYRYWFRGKLYRHPGGEKKSDAQKALSKALGAIAKGNRPPPDETKLTLKELADDFLRDYRVSGKRSTFAAEARVKHLVGFFGERKRAIDVTTDEIRKYQEHRQQEHVCNARKNSRGEKPRTSNGTINRELSSLKRMFNLAKQAGKLSFAPYIPTLQEAQPRQGFLEHEEYLAIRSHLGAVLQDVFDFGYNSGWRKGAILGLEWGHVRFEERLIRLPPALAKNKRGWALPLSEPIWEVICRRWEQRTPACPYVFHRTGKQLKNFNRAWQNACKAAGVPGKLFHDCRRTVARNLIKSGVPEKIAMQITQHETPDVFRRYQITTDGDLWEATAKLAQFNQEQAEAPKALPPKKATGS